MKEVAARFKRELAVYQKAIKHPGTPRLAKALLGLAIAYLLMPFDLIPDFIPVLGQLDDLVIIPLLVVLAVWLIPAHVLGECRQEEISEA